MKNLLNNQKGSVLSVAFIVIALLSFAITATTVHSFNVANRTNANISTQDQELFAKQIISQVFYEIKYNINDYKDSHATFDPNSYDDIVFLEELETRYEEIISAYYISEFGISVDDLNDFTFLSVSVADLNLAEFGENEFIRQYTVEFKLYSGNTVKRDLLISMIETQVPKEYDFTDYDQIFQFFQDDYFEPEQIIECGDVSSTECDADDIAYIIDDEADNKKSYVFNDNDAYITSSLDMVIGKGGKDNELILNGNVIYVQGDLTLGDLVRIENISQNDGKSGIILVEGDLVISHDIGASQTSLEMDNVVMIVKGAVRYDNDKATVVIDGNNFSILSRLVDEGNVSNYPLTDSTTNPVYRYYLDQDGEKISNYNVNGFTFMGTSEQFDLTEDIIKKNSMVFEVEGIENIFQFDYAETAFNEG